jgi:asparagine synthase (glutamine-hydrolysing)
MCGLISIHTKNRDLSDTLSILDNMVEKIIHRGPDDEGKIHVPNQALFGHRRLSIIDIEYGQQPMRSDDQRYTLVYNGEIYNYIEVRELLIKEGLFFKSFSDTEVLFQLLIKKGSEGLGYLNGMFSFVFHDSKTNTWIAARDHFGIKPLYYAQCGSDLVFASEIKAILEHPEIQAERDEYSLQQYLTFQFCLDNRTLFKGIKKVRPGHFVIGDGSEIEKEVCYWKPNYEIDTNKTEEWFECQLQYLLKNSINLQMRADVPIGTYLSGGTDSSLVSFLASKRSSKSLPMFHGKFNEGPEYDESYFAKEMAQFSNGDYFEVIPTAEDFVKLLPKLIYDLDEPLAGPGVFPQYLTSKLAAKHVKVVLGGQGGDEIFGGYTRYLIGYLEQALKGAILGTQEEGKHLVTIESIIPNLSVLKEYLPLLSHFWSKNLFENMDQRYFHLIDRSHGFKSVLHEDIYKSFDRERIYSDFQDIFNKPKTASYINKMTYFDQNTLLPALLQVEDRVGMSASIESRVPLLDYKIVDLVRKMPPELKFKGGKMKYILKKSIANWLPPKILNRKDKMGFPVPLKEWMKKGIVRDFVGDTLLSKKSLNRSIYRKIGLETMIDNSGVAGRQLWGALCLELWHQVYIDGNR